MPAARRLAVGAALLMLFAGCTTGASPGSTSASNTVLRLGYFPNVTHASAVAGVADGIFADAMGDNVTLDVRTFNAGPDVVEAMFSGALDASFIGPNPAINAFTRSNGEAIRIVSGATSGGAFFVVRDGIDSADELRGTKIASPQLGNTQDVALRAWLHEQGLTADEQGGGDVSIVPQGNSQTLETFISGDIDGAWVPEPWATRLIEEGGGHMLVDERDLWSGGQYVTTHLIVRTEFLEQHPDVVKHLIEGLLAATDFVNDSPAEAQATVVEAIGQITGSSLSPDILAKAWQNLTFTVDPIVSSLQESANDAEELGFLESADLEGIYDLALLNEVLAEAGRPEITQP
jgi:NitT/TauT family transport system substrate-binding protein